MNKLTDEQIVKALEYCFLSDCACNKCPYAAAEVCENDKMIKTVIDLINRKDTKITELTQEINRQKTEIENSAQCTTHNSQLIELRKKCVEKQEFLIGDDNRYKGYVSIEDLDYIIDESGIRNY